MKNLIYLMAFVISTSLVIVEDVTGQVTVGSGIEPNKGAVLDLKEYVSESDITTSTKGLMLPRVKLTDLNNLYPMFLGDSDYQNNIGGKKDSEDALHTGLTVYATLTDYCNESFPGIYTWDGKKWQSLNKSEFKGEVDILVDDRDPDKIERYRIGKFGKAGWWMLENLRATKWPNNPNEGANVADLICELPVTIDIEPVPVAKPRYYYPKGDSADFIANPHHGYVYDLMAALRITETEADDMTFPLAGRQGICPNGWRIPTSEDWALLALSIQVNAAEEDGEIYLNPCKYAHSDINHNVGFNMISMEEPGNGKSRTMEEGGFNAKLVGRIIPSSTLGVPNFREVGSRAYFWLGLRNVNGYGDFDVATLDKDIYAGALYKHMTSRSQLSVRCVKNE